MSTLETMTLTQICVNLDNAAKNTNLPPDQVQAIINAEIIIRNAWDLCRGTPDQLTGVDLCNRIAEDLT